MVQLCSGIVIKYPVKIVIWLLWLLNTLARKKYSHLNNQHFISIKSTCVVLIHQNNLAHNSLRLKDFGTGNKYGLDGSALESLLRGHGFEPRDSRLLFI